MKKKILIPIIIAAVALGALALVSCGKNKGDTVDIPYVNDFTCDYYDKNGNVINDKSKVFKYGDEIRVKIGFSLSSKAYAAGKRDLTLKFAPPDDFAGKILSANSSTTSSKSFTALYTVDDKRDKKCEVELQIDVYYSAGSLKICYAYDDEEYTEAGAFPLNNDKVLQYDYDAATDGYIVSRDFDDSEWFENLKEISFPDSFAGKPVTGFDIDLFFNCVNLRTIEIPESITVTGVDSIFAHCENLQYNEYDNACYLGNKQNPYIALVSPINREMTSVNINKSTKVIYCDAFSDCSGLKSISIPDGVTEIGARAFYGCSDVTSISIPDSITSIGEDAFWGCNSSAYNKFENALYLGNEKNPFVACMGISSNSESVNIKAGTKVIGNHAFYACSMRDVKIPDSVMYIEGNAFTSCQNLTSVTIPNGVTRIGYQTFYECSGLTSVTIPNSVRYIGSYAFEDCNSLTGITIPDSVMYIGSYAFEDCNSLTGIMIPDSVTHIGDEVFSMCSALTSVTIPDSVTTIGYGVFKQCSSLTSVRIPNGIKWIRNETFSGCSSLTDISMPDSITEIWELAFNGCSSLTSITIPKMSYLWKGCFLDCSNLTSIVYRGTIAEWKAISSAAGESSDTGNVTIKCSDGEFKFKFNE